jgi:hypothetical protein
MLVLPVRSAVGLLEATRCLSVGLYYYSVLCRNLTDHCNMGNVNSASSRAGVLLKLVLWRLYFFCVLLDDYSLRLLRFLPL